MRAAPATDLQGRPGDDGHWLDAERLRVYPILLLVIFAIMLVWWTWRSLPGLVDPDGKPVGYDFIAFWSAAKLAVMGRPAAAFDWYAIQAAHYLAVPGIGDKLFLWHYPPTYLLMVLPLGLMPYLVALVVFLGTTGALWAALVCKMLPDRRAWLVAAAAPAGLLNTMDGQNGLLTAGLAGFALLLLRRRPTVAGVLIGLLVIKPHLAVLFPLALLAERRWRTIAAAAATAALFVAASVAAFGWGTFAAFLHDLPSGRLLIDQGALPWGAIPSPYAFLLSIGLKPSGAAAGQAAAALIAAACVYRVWHNRAAPFEAKAATLLAGSLLVSPFLFNYDMTWTVVAIGWLVVLGLRDGFRRGEREMLLFVWLVPLAMQPIAALIGVQPGCVALLLLLFVAVRRAAPPTAGERERLRRAFDALRTASWINRERVLRWGTACAVAAIVAFAIDAMVHTTHGVTNSGGEFLGRDFVNFWAGARLAAGGQAALAYDPAAYDAFLKSALSPLAELKLYTYPPVTMMLSLPLAALPYIPAFAIWTLLGILACAAPLSRLIGWRAAALATVGAPAGILDLIVGQNGHFTAALFGGGLMLLDRQPVLAGILLGCLSYKPQMGLLLPVALAAGGRWRTVAAAAATVIVLLTASVLLLGSESWLSYRGQADLERALMETAGPYWQRTQTVFLALHNDGVSVTSAYAAQVVSAILAAGATAAVWRGGASLGIKSATLILATFLASPYAWDYDMVVTMFAAAWLAREGYLTGFLAWERFTIALLLIQPIVTLQTTELFHVQFAPLGLWFAMVVTLRRGLLASPRLRGKSMAAMTEAWSATGVSLGDPRGHSDR